MKFASKKKLSKFLVMTNQSLDPEDFDFTPYGQQQQDREQPQKLPDQGTSAHFETEYQYVVPRMENTEPACTHLHTHGGAHNNAHLQPVEPVIMLENNPNSIILQLPQPQVLNFSLNQTITQPLSICEDHQLERGAGGERETARAKMLATAINAATRDGERLASTSSLLASSTMVTSEQQQQQTFDGFNATYKATTSSYLPNFHIMESYNSQA